MKEALGYLTIAVAVVGGLCFLLLFVQCWILLSLRSARRTEKIVQALVIHWHSDPEASNYDEVLHSLIDQLEVALKEA